jgi:hypothetical protein
MNSVSVSLPVNCDALTAFFDGKMVRGVVSARIDMEKPGQARYSFVQAQDDGKGGKRLVGIIHQDDSRAKAAKSRTPIPDTEFVEVPFASADEQDSRDVREVQSAVAAYFGCDPKTPKETAKPTPPKGEGTDLARAIAEFMAGPDDDDEEIVSDDDDLDGK